MALTLFSIYAWLVWVLHLVLFGPPTLLLTLVAPTLGFRAIRFFSRSALAMAGIRVVVRDRDRIDWSRAYVLMANHPSMLDPFVLVVAVPHHMVGVEKRENFRIPVYGALTRAWGNIPIHREDPQAAREAIALAEERLRAGTSIVILPEGTRSRTGAIGRFKKGGFHLAVNAGAAIVPVTMNGVYERYHQGDWRVRPGVVEVVYGTPIATEEADKADIDGLLARVQAAIASRYAGVDGRRLPPAD